MRQVIGIHDPVPNAALGQNLVLERLVAHRGHFVAANVDTAHDAAVCIADRESAIQAIEKFVPVVCLVHIRRHGEAGDGKFDEHLLVKHDFAKPCPDAPFFGIDQ